LKEQEELKYRLKEQNDELQAFKERPLSQKQLKNVSERTRQKERNDPASRTANKPHSSNSQTKISHTEKLRLEREKKRKDA
jgi:hypothetical protein